jgi:hypothetical protein
MTLTTAFNRVGPPNNCLHHFHIIITVDAHCNNYNTYSGNSVSELGSIFTYKKKADLTGQSYNHNSE